MHNDYLSHVSTFPVQQVCSSMPSLVATITWSRRRSSVQQRPKIEKIHWFNFKPYSSKRLQRLIMITSKGRTATGIRRGLVVLASYSCGKSGKNRCQLTRGKQLRFHPGACGNECRLQRRTQLRKTLSGFDSFQPSIVSGFLAVHINNKYLS